MSSLDTSQIMTKGKIFFDIYLAWMLIVMNREYTTVVTIMLIAIVMIIYIFCNTLIMIVMIIMGMIIDIFCNMLPPARPICSATNVLLDRHR